MHRYVLQGLMELRQNYWFWPSVLTIAAVILGVGVPAIDRVIGGAWMDQTGLLRAIQVDGARSLLATLAAAVLGVAGVSFSITIVAVSFASGTFGPRLVGNFMRDRTNQVVLGIFLGTFVYCITVLGTVHDATGEGGSAGLPTFVPQLAIMLAQAFTLASVGALIYFIHHVPESINIMNLAARIGHALRETLSKRPEEREETTLDGPPDRNEPARDVTAATTGYLTEIDIERLHKLADENDIDVVLDRTAGDFVLAGELVLVARPRGLAKEVDPDEFATCIAIGPERTADQDELFLADELVEIIGRALSPGTNDPHTAITCLDWVRAALAAFARGCPGGEWRRHGHVTYRRITFESLTAHVFGRVRQYVASDRNATLHALEVLTTVALAAPLSRRHAVAAEAGALASAAADALPSASARDEVALAHKAFQRRLAEGRVHRSLERAA